MHQPTDSRLLPFFDVMKLHRELEKEHGPIPTDDLHPDTMLSLEDACIYNYIEGH